jgi:hypothetical protein
VNSTKSSIKAIAGSGGAFYYTCSPDYLECNMVLDNTNQFKNNYAQKQGGAIYWDVVEPSIAKTTQFSTNLAVFYGNDIAAYAVQLVTITEE